MRDCRKSSKVISTCPRLLRWLLSMTPINLFHDLLCPTDRVGNRSYRCRHALSTVVLRELTSRKNRSGNQKNALATFIHINQRTMFAFCSLSTFLPPPRLPSPVLEIHP